jgi:alpha-tubulin suppressor-like RCC1 family protein
MRKIPFLGAAVCLAFLAIPVASASGVPRAGMSLAHHGAALGSLVRPSTQRIPPVAITAGNDHTCGLLKGGGVDCWGENYHGQFGFTTPNLSTTAIIAHGLSGTQVSAGNGFTCVLLASATVDCLGSNADGALGDGGTADSATPMAVSGLSGAARVAAGDVASCALITGGTVKCWGDNAHDLMGVGGSAVARSARQVPGLSGVTQVATQGSPPHSCALLSDHRIRCWGDGQYGQLGDGAFASSTTPKYVAGITNAIEVTTGDSFSCALLSTRKVDCWGLNTYAELGNPLPGIASEESATPVGVRGLSKIITIASGYDHSCALLSTHRVDCWGLNYTGELGDGTINHGSTQPPVPVAVKGLASVTALSLGNDDSCALTTSAAVWCWGYNAVGELGNATSGNYSALPDEVQGIA